MSFCPKCKYEYREGIEKCPDCDERLVPELKVSLNDSELVTAATFLVPYDAEMAKLRLHSCGIQSVIIGDITRLNVAAALMDADIRLLVRREDLHAARKILSED